MKKNKFSIFMICVFTIFCLAGVGLFANDFSEVEVASAASPTADEWDGTTPSSTTIGEADWYKKDNTTYYINSAAGLAYFKTLVNASSGYNSFENCTVFLTVDIDLKGYDFGAISGFASSGSTNNRPFKGTFDGQGHTIYNVNVTASATNCTSRALFGYNAGTIKNLSLSGVDISSTTVYSAALVAYNEGTIENCSVRGEVESSGQYLGAIAGRSTGTISNCANFATVTSTYASGTAYVGGIVGAAVQDGNNCSYVEECYNEGAISASSGNVGGLVGDSRNLDLTNSYNAGSVTAGTQLGGLVGNVQENVEISFCYNSGSVTGGSSVARGLIGGYSSTTASITNCFDVSTYYSNSTPYPDSIEASYVAYATTSDDLSELQLLAKTSEFYLASTYSYFSADWDTSIWKVTAYSYPQLDVLNYSADKNTTTEKTLLGEGTEESPYLIYTAADLALVGSAGAGDVGDGLTLSSYYTLMADLDLTGSTWTPIGIDNGTIGFTGVFDGNNHTITGLTSSMQAAYSYYGLFAVTSNEAVIKDLTIASPVIYLSYKASCSGVLIGYARGTTYIVNVSCVSATFVSSSNRIYAVGSYSSSSLYVIYGKNNLVDGSLDTSTFSLSSTPSKTGYDIVLDTNGAEISEATFDGDGDVDETTKFAYGEYHIIVYSSGKISSSTKSLDILQNVRTYQATLPEDINKITENSSASFIGSIVLSRIGRRFSRYAENNDSDYSWSMTGSTTAPKLTTEETNFADRAVALISDGLTIVWYTGFDGDDDGEYEYRLLRVKVYNMYELQTFDAGSYYDDAEYCSEITSGLSSYGDFTIDKFSYSSSDCSTTINGVSIDLSTMYYDSSTNVLFMVEAPLYGTTYTPGVSTYTPPTASDAIADNTIRGDGYTFGKNSIYTDSSFSSVAKSRTAVANQMLYIKWDYTSVEVITINFHLYTDSSFSFDPIDAVITDSNDDNYVSYSYNQNSNYVEFSVDIAPSELYDYSLTSADGYYFTTEGAYTQENHDTIFGQSALSSTDTTSTYSVSGGSGKDSCNTLTFSCVNFIGGGTYTIELYAAKYEQTDAIAADGSYFGFGANYAMTITDTNGTYSTNVEISVNGSTASSLEDILGDDAQTILASLYEYQSSGNSIYIAFDFLNGRILFSSDGLDSVAYDAIAVSKLSNNDYINVTIGTATYKYTITDVSTTGATITVTNSSCTDPYLLKVTIEGSEYSEMSYYTYNDFIFIGEVPNQYSSAQWVGYIYAFTGSGSQTNATFSGIYGRTILTTDELSLTSSSNSSETIDVTQKALFSFSSFASQSADNTLIFEIQSYVTFQFVFVDEDGNEVTSYAPGLAPEYFLFSPAEITLSQNATPSTIYRVIGLDEGSGVVFEDLTKGLISTKTLKLSDVLASSTFSLDQNDVCSITYKTVSNLTAGIYTFTLLCEERSFLIFDSFKISYENYTEQGTSASGLYSVVTGSSDDISIDRMTIKVNNETTYMNSGTILALKSSDSIVISTDGLTEGAADDVTGYFFVGFVVTGTIVTTEGSSASSSNYSIQLISADDLEGKSLTYGELYGKIGLTFSKGSSITVYAIWAPKLTTITLNLNDTNRVGDASLPTGSTVKSYTIYTYYGATGFYNTDEINSEAKTISAEELVAVLTAYNFMGWYLSDEKTQIISGEGRLLYLSKEDNDYGNSDYVSSSGTWAYDSSGDTLTLKLYAVWEAIQYTITYSTGEWTNAYGSTVYGSVKSFQYDIEDEFTLTSLSLLGYTFAGWELLSTDGNWPSAGSSGTTTTINHDSNGYYISAGTYYDTIEKLLCDQYSGLYVYDGTFYYVAGSNSYTEMYGNITLSALWKEHTYTIKFTSGVEDDKNVTSDLLTSPLENVFYSSLIDVSLAIERTSFDFDGWDIDKDSSSALSGDRTFVSSSSSCQAQSLTAVDGGTVTLVATWNVDTEYTYTITAYLQNTDGTYDKAESTLIKTTTPNGVQDHTITLSYTYGYVSVGINLKEFDSGVTYFTYDSAEGTYTEVDTTTTPTPDVKTEYYIKEITTITFTNAITLKTDETDDEMKDTKISYEGFTFDSTTSNLKTSYTVGEVIEIYFARIEYQLAVYVDVGVSEVAVERTTVSGEGVSLAAAKDDDDSPTVWTFSVYYQAEVKITITEARGYSFDLICETSSTGSFSDSTALVSTLSSMPSKGVTLSATTVAKNYTITFITSWTSINGDEYYGEISDSDIAAITADGYGFTLVSHEDGSYVFEYTVESTIAFAEPVIVGYDFCYWIVTSANGTWAKGDVYYTGDALTEMSGDPDEGIVIETVYSAKSYTIIFSTETSSGSTQINGFSPTSVTVVYDSNVIYEIGTYGTANEEESSIPVPSRYGYTFVGWFTALAGTIQLVDEEGLKIEGAYFDGDGNWIYDLEYYGYSDRTITLYAVWEANVHKVTFNSSVSSGTTEVDDFTTTVVYYIFDSDVIYATSNTNSVASIPDPTRTGYTFVGWFTDSVSGSQLFKAGGSTVTGTYFDSTGNWIYDDDVEVFTHWTAITYSSVLTPTAMVEDYGVIITTGNYSSYEGLGYSLSDAVFVQTSVSESEFASGTYYTYSSGTYALATEYDASATYFIAAGDEKNSSVSFTATFDSISTFTATAYLEGYMFNTWTWIVGEETVSATVIVSSQGKFSISGGTDQFDTIEELILKCGKGLYVYSTEYVDVFYVYNLTTENENVQLYTDWSVIKTTITLNLNDSEGSTRANCDIETIVIAYDSSTIYSNDTEVSASDLIAYRDGYTFGGFYFGESDQGGSLTLTTQLLDASGNLLSSIAGYTTEDGIWCWSAGDFEIYALWTALTYTITLDRTSCTSSNTGASSVTVVFDTATLVFYKGSKEIDLVNNPGEIQTVKTGYDFIGWYSGDEDDADAELVISTAGDLQASTQYTDDDGYWTYVYGTAVTLYAHYVARDDTKFTIKVFFQGTHGVYGETDSIEVELDPYQGTSDTSISVSASGTGVSVSYTVGDDTKEAILYNNETGFYYDYFTWSIDAKNYSTTSLTSGSCNLDQFGNTKISIYFARESYQLSLTADEHVAKVTFVDGDGDSFSNFGSESNADDSTTYTAAVYYQEYVEIGVEMATGYVCTTSSIYVSQSSSNSTTLSVNCVDLFGNSSKYYTLEATLNMPSGELLLEAVSTIFYTSVILTQNKVVTEGTSSATIDYYSTTMDYGNEFVAPTRAGYTFSGYWTSSDNGETFGVRIIDSTGTLSTGITGYVNSSGGWVYSYDDLTLYCVWELLSDFGQIVNLESGDSFTYDGVSHTFSIFDYFESQCEFIEIDKGISSVTGTSVEFSLTCNNNAALITSGNMTVTYVETYVFEFTVKLFDNEETCIATWVNSFYIEVLKAEFSSIVVGETTKVANAKILMSAFVPDSVGEDEDEIVFEDISTIDALAKFAKIMNSSDSDLQKASNDDIYAYLLTKYYLIVTTSEDLTYRLWTYSDYEAYAEENSETISTLTSVLYFFTYDLDTASDGEVDLANGQTASTTFTISDITINGVNDETYAASGIAISASELSVGTTVALNVYSTDATLTTNYATNTSSNGIYVVSYSSVLVLPQILELDNYTSKTSTYFSSSATEYEVDFVGNGTAVDVGSYESEYVMDYDNGAIYVYVEMQTYGDASATSTTSYSSCDTKNLIYVTYVRFYYVNATSGDVQNISSRLKFALSKDFVFSVLRIDNALAISMESLYHTIDSGKHSLTEFPNSFAAAGISVSQITYYNTYTKTSTTVDVDDASEWCSFSDDGTIFYVQRYSSSEIEKLEADGANEITVTSVTFSVQNTQVSDYVSLYKWSVGDFEETSVDGTSGTTDTFIVDITGTEFDYETDEGGDFVYEELLEKQVYAVYTDLVLVTFDLSCFDGTELTIDNIASSQVIKLGVSTVDDIVLPACDGLVLKTCILAGENIDLLTSSSTIFTGDDGEYVGYYANLLKTLSFECTWSAKEVSLSESTQTGEFTYAVGTLSSFSFDDVAVLLNINTTLYDYSYEWTQFGGDTSNIESDDGTMTFTDGGTTKNSGTYKVTVTATLKNVFVNALGISSADASSSASVEVTLTFMAYRIDNINTWYTSSSYDTSEKIYSWEVVVAYWTYDNDEQSYTTYSEQYYYYTQIGDVTFEVKDSNDVVVTSMIYPDTYTISILFAEGKYEISDSFTVVDNSGVDEFYYVYYDFAGSNSSEDADEDKTFKFESDVTYYVYSGSEYVALTDDEISAGPVDDTSYYTKEKRYVGYLTDEDDVVGVFTYELSKRVVNLQNYAISSSKTFNTEDPDMAYTLSLVEGTPTITLRREAGEAAGSYSLYFDSATDNNYVYYNNGYLLYEDGVKAEGYYLVGYGQTSLEEFEDGTDYFTSDGTTYTKVDTAVVTTPVEDVGYYVYGVLADLVSIGDFSITSSTALRLEFADVNASLSYVAGGYEISLAYDDALSLVFTDSSGNATSFEMKIYDLTTASYITTSTTLNGYNIYSIILEAMQTITVEEEEDDETGETVEVSYASITPVLFFSGSSVEAATSVGTYTIGFELDYFANFYSRVDMLSTSTFTLAAATVNVSLYTFSKVFDGDPSYNFDLETYGFADLAIRVTYSSFHVATDIPVTLTLIYTGDEEDEDAQAAYLQSFTLSSQTSTGTIKALEATISFTFTQSKDYTYGDVDINNLAALIDTITLTDTDGNDVSSLLFEQYYEIKTTLNSLATGNEVQASGYNAEGYVYAGNYYLLLKDSTFDDFDVTNLSSLSGNFSIGTLTVEVVLPSDYVSITNNDTFASSYTGSVTVPQTLDEITTVYYSVVYETSDLKDGSSGTMLNEGTYAMALLYPNQTYVNDSVKLTMASNKAFTVIAENVTLYVRITDSTSALSQVFTGAEFTLTYNSDQTVTISSYQKEGTLTSFVDQVQYYTYDSGIYTAVDHDDVLQPDSDTIYYTKTSATVSVSFYTTTTKADAGQTVIKTQDTITGVTFKSIEFTFNSTARNVGTYYVSMTASGAQDSTGTSYSQVVLSDQYAFEITQKTIDVTALDEISVVYGTKSTTIEDFDEKAVDDTVSILATFATYDVGTGISVSLTLTGTNKTNYVLSGSTTTGTITQALAEILLSQSEFEYGQLTWENYEKFLTVLSSVGQIVSDASIKIYAVTKDGTDMSQETGFVGAGTYSLTAYATSTNYSITSNATGSAEISQETYSTYTFSIVVSQYSFSVSDVTLTISYGDDISSGVEYTIITYYGETSTFMLDCPDCSGSIGTYSITDGTYSDQSGNYSATITNFSLEVVASSTTLYLLVYDDENDTLTNMVSFTYDGYSYTSITITYEYDDDSDAYIPYLVLSSGSSLQKFALKLYTYDSEEGEYEEYTTTLGDLTGTLSSSSTIRNVGTYNLLTPSISSSTNNVKIGYYAASLIYFYVKVEAKEVVFDGDSDYITDSVISNVFTNEDAEYTYVASDLISGIADSDQGSLEVIIKFTTDDAGQTPAKTVATGLYVWATLSDNYVLVTDETTGLLQCVSSDVYSTLHGAITKAQLTFTASAEYFTYGTISASDLSSLSYKLSADNASLSSYIEDLSVTLSLSSDSKSTAGYVPAGTYYVSASLSDDNVEISNFVIDGNQLDEGKTSADAWTLTITQLNLTLVGTISKDYDGTTDVNLAGLSLSGAMTNDVVSISKATYETTFSTSAISVTVELSGTDSGNYTLTGVYGTIATITLTITYNYNDTDNQNAGGAKTETENKNYALLTTLSYPFTATQTLTSNSAVASTEDNFPKEFVSESYVGHTFSHWTLNLQVTTGETDYDSKVALISSLESQYSLAIATSTEGSVTTYAITVGNNAKTVSLLAALAEDSLFGYYHGAKAFEFVANWELATYEAAFYITDKTFSASSNKIASVEILLNDVTNATFDSSTLWSKQFEYGSKVTFKITSAGDFSTFYGIYSSLTSEYLLYTNDFTATSQTTGAYSYYYESGSDTTTYFFSIDSLSANYSFYFVFQLEQATVIFTIPTGATVSSAGNFRDNSDGTYVWTTDYYEVANTTFEALPTLVLPSGYTLSHYKVGDEEITDYTTTFENYISSLEVTVTVVLKENSYTITFSTSNEYGLTYSVSPSAIDVSYLSSTMTESGSTTTVTSAPVLDVTGYTFAGWYLEDLETQVFDKSGNKVVGTYFSSEGNWIYTDGNLVVYAKFTIETYTVMITYANATISSILVNGSQFASVTTTSTTTTLTNVQYGSTLTFTIQAQQGYSISTTDLTAAQYSNGNASVVVTETLIITFTSEALDNTVTLSGDNVASVTVTITGVSDPVSWTTTGSAIDWDSVTAYFTVKTAVKFVIVAVASAGYTFSASNLTSLGCDISNDSSSGTLTLTFSSISSDIAIEFETNTRSYTVTVVLNDVTMFANVNANVSGIQDDYLAASVELTLSTGDTLRVTTTTATGYEIYTYSSDFTVTTSFGAGDTTKSLALTFGEIAQDGKVYVYARIETFEVTVGVKTYDNSNQLVESGDNTASITYNYQTGTTFSNVKSGDSVTLTASTTSLTYTFTGWQLDDETISYSEEYEYTVTAAVTIYAIFSAASFTGSLETLEKVTYPSGTTELKDISGGTFTDYNEETTTSFKVFYGASVSYTLTVKSGYYLVSLGYYYDDSDNLQEITSYGTGEYASSVTITLKGTDFATYGVKRVVAILQAYSLTIDVSTIVNIDGYLVENSGIATVELVDSTGNSADSEGYVSRDSSRVYISSVTAKNKEFSVVAYTGDEVFLKVTITKDGYAIKDVTLDGESMTIYEEGSDYLIYKIDNLVASSQAITLEALAVLRPKTNSINLKMIESGNIVDAGGFVVSDASGMEYQMVWSGANYLSSVQVSAYTGGIVCVVAYIRVGYVFANAITDSAAIISGSYEYEELSIEDTGFTGKVTFYLSGFEYSSSIYLQVTAQTYTVVLKNGDETLATIANVAFGSVLDLSASNQNITIISRDVYFTSAGLTFSISDSSHTFRGFYTQTNGTGTQYINSDGEATSSWSERGYTFDTITNKYVISDNVKVVNGVFEVSLFAYETYLKTVITFSVFPSAVSALTANDLIDGVDATNSWFNASTPDSIEISFNTDIRFVAPEISGYKFYRFVITQIKSDGTSLSDVTSYSSSVPWSTNKSEDITEVVVSVEYFAQATVNAYGGNTSYTLSQTGSDAQALSLLDAGYFDTTKDLTLTAVPGEGYLFSHWVVVRTGQLYATASVTLSASYSLELDLYVYGKTVTLSFASSEYVTTYGIISTMRVTDYDGSSSTQILGLYGETKTGMIYQIYQKTASVRVGDSVVFYVVADEGFAITWNRSDISYLSYSESDGAFLFSFDILPNMAEDKVDIVAYFDGETLSFYVNLCWDEELEEAIDGNDTSLAGYVSVNGESVTSFTSSQRSDVTFAIVTKERYGVASITIENYNVTYDGLEAYLLDGIVVIPNTYITENSILGVVKLNVVFTRLLWENVSCDMFEGSGTSDDPYIITTAEELALMLQLCNSGALNSRGVEYRTCSYSLQENIELNERYWTPIGTDQYAFDGTFNFNGHSVSMIYFTEPVTGTTYDGLFGVLGNDANIIVSTTSLWWVYLTAVLGIGVAGGLAGFAVINVRRRKRNRELSVR